jgi:outer membrane protein OmpA-like peptidoglycan-associated protein
LITMLGAALLSGCQSTPKGLSAEQVALLKSHGFQWTDEGWELGLSGKVLFDTDSEVVSGTSAEQLTKITQALLGVGIQQVRLEGHTDNVGQPAYNQQLSLRRAQKVAAVMQAAGMDANLIASHGLGQSKPIADNATAEGRSENRRVSIIVSTP